VRIVFFILLIGVIAGAAAILTTHELGERPAHTIAPLEPAADVKYIEANAIKSGFIEKGEGPLVLLFHGYPETARSWKAVQQRIADAGYRAVAVYMRGYPPTSPGTDYSVKSLGDDIVALIDAFGEDQAIIVGHDWGAIAVYEAAFVAPERVSHLVALAIPHPRGIGQDPMVFWKAPHFLYYQSPWATRLIWSHNFRHIRAIYETWSPGFDVPEEEIADVIATFKVPGAIEAALGYYWALIANGPDNARLSADGEITVPSLVIAGDNDGAIDLLRFEEAASGFADQYVYKELAGVGHFPQLEAPDAVADAVIQFVRD